MAYRPQSSGARRLFRRGARFRLGAGPLALIAVLLYTLAPFALPDQATARPLVEICTAQGIVTVPLPGADGPADAPAAPDMTDCPACALASHGGVHAKIVPPPAVVPALPAAETAILQFPVWTDRPSGVAVSTQRPRGPPLPV